MTSTFDLESGVRVACDVGYLWPILVFLGLSVFDLGQMYATDRQTSDRRQTKASLNAPAYEGRGHNHSFLLHLHEHAGSLNSVTAVSLSLSLSNLCSISDIYATLTLVYTVYCILICVD